MEINDILNISVTRRPNTQKSADERGREQTIVHFESISRVTTSEFRGSLDPLIVYRAKDAQEQIKIEPFNYNNKDKETLSIIDKLQFYKKEIRTLDNNILIDTISPDLDVISIDTTEMGSYNDFLVSFVSPLDNGVTLESFFGSIFLELDTNELTNFTNGIQGAING